MKFKMLVLSTISILKRTKLICLMINKKKVGVIPTKRDRGKVDLILEIICLV